MDRGELCQKVKGQGTARPNTVKKALENWEGHGFKALNQ